MRTADLNETSRGASQMVYVDANLGNDTNPGTESMPYATVSAALASITDAADAKRYSVMIAPGEYDEQVVMIPWVTLKGYTGNDSAVITKSDDHTVVFPAPMANDPGIIEGIRINCTSANAAHRAVYCEGGGNGALVRCSLANLGAGFAAESLAASFLGFINTNGNASANGAVTLAGFGLLSGTWTGDGVTAPDITTQAGSGVILLPSLEAGNGTTSYAALSVLLRTHLAHYGAGDLAAPNWASPPTSLLDAMDRMATALSGVLGVPIP